MRLLLGLLATALLVSLSIVSIALGQSADAGHKPSSPARNADADSALQYLIDSAASDFQAHEPHPDRFRRVRFGQRMNADGTEQYVLCGEFLPAQSNGKTEWMRFATIKTSGYEQYFGGQGVTFCQDSKVKWNKEGLTHTLQNRYDSMTAK
jgi:hypothetical protein